MKFHRLIVFLMLAAAMAGCGEKIEPPSTPTIPRMPAPHFELLDINGNKISSDSFFGKIVILNFWASWSPACVREIPEWVKLQAEYESKGVVFVGINVDSEGAAVAKPYAEKRMINYPILLGSMDLGAEFGGLDGIPSTYIIDREWNLVNRYTNLTPPESIKSEIHALLQLDRQKALGNAPASSPPVSSKAGDEPPSPYAPKLEEEKKVEVQEVPVEPEPVPSAPAQSEAPKSAEPAPAQ